MAIDQLRLFADPEPVDPDPPDADPFPEPPGDHTAIAPMPVDAQQSSFIDEHWRDEWQSMPRYESADVAPAKMVNVLFERFEDAQAFAALVGQPITANTKAIWFPEVAVDRWDAKRWIDATGRTWTHDDVKKKHEPRYPIYIVSKGRWESRMTARALAAMGVAYHIVVEPQESDAYRAAVGAERVLELPFANLGQGSIPARNWIWEHAIAGGHERHWIMDDNIAGFLRMTDNLKAPVMCGNIFAAAENFVDRYENVAFAGLNYDTFARRRVKQAPYRLNTRIYSCILIHNALPYRWRGRYNEDTDLSLRALKDGLCTVLFNAFQCRKQTTMKMKGGNTDELYAGDGRLRMAESLREQHPDVTTVKWKWNRWQHEVDYSRFEMNRLVRRRDITVAPGADEFGMVLEVDDGARAGG